MGLSARRRFAEKDLAVIAHGSAGVMAGAERQTHHPFRPVDRDAEVLEPVIEHGALRDAPIAATPLEPVEIAAADDGIAFLCAHGDTVVGGDVRLRRGRLAFEVDYALPQDMLGHRYRGRSRHNPREIFLERA